LQMSAFGVRADMTFPRCTRLLLTQSGHCDDPVSLIMGAVTSAGSLSPNRSEFGSWSRECPAECVHLDG
ncbi:MAG: hypothetical protein WBZ25_06945, partial [Pseudolabrys sp.]